MSGKTPAWVWLLAVVGILLTLAIATGSVLGFVAFREVLAAQDRMLTEQQNARAEEERAREEEQLRIDAEMEDAQHRVEEATAQQRAEEEAAANAGHDPLEALDGI